jgi:hypothetical protein
MLPCVDGSTCFILDYWIIQLIVEMDIQSDLWMTVYIFVSFTFYILYSYDWFYIYVHGFMEDTINWNEKKKEYLHLKLIILSWLFNNAVSIRTI